MDPAAILITSSIAIMFLTLISASYKTGFVSYSMQSMTRRDQPRFEVDKSKVGKFVGYTAGAFVLNVLYGLVVVQSISEMEGILILSLLNTVFIGYGLSFWILLKEKKERKGQ